MPSSHENSCEAYQNVFNASIISVKIAKHRDDFIQIDVNSFLYHTHSDMAMSLLLFNF